MIYTPGGEPATIVANCGEHQVRGFCTPVILVRIQCSDGDERYEFAPFLRADGGFPEILTAIQNARPARLSAVALEAAIRQAI